MSRNGCYTLNFLSCWCLKCLTAFWRHLNGIVSLRLSLTQQHKQTEPSYM